MVTPYDFTLTDNLDDMREIVGINANFNPSSVDDNSGSGTGVDFSDAVPGWSFPSVNLTTCTSAFLYLEHIGISGGGPGVSYRIRGQSNAAAPSSQWNTTTNRPINSGAIATATTVTELGDPAGSGVFHTINVTAIVQEIMAGAFWASGQRINFWAEANLIIFLIFGRVSNSGNVGTPARLVINP